MKKLKETFEQFQNFPKKKQILGTLISVIVPQNLEEGNLWDFSNFHSVAKYRKNEVVPFEEIKKL